MLKNTFHLEPESMHCNYDPLLPPAGKSKELHPIHQVVWMGSESLKSDHVFTGTADGVLCTTNHI